MTTPTPRPALEGRLVRLRSYEAADYGSLNELFNDPDVGAGVGMPVPQAVAGHREFVEGLRSQKDQTLYAIETLEGREAVGGCSLMGIDGRNRSADLGIWIGKPYWSKGYGTDAMRTLCAFGFRHMNLSRIELNVFENNPRAMRIYEKVGFKLEGTRRRSQFTEGQYVDSYVMALLADELVDGREKSRASEGRDPPPTPVG